MKGKKLLVSFFACGFAMASAFANHSLLRATAWIKVKYAGESAFVCRSSSVEACSNRVSDKQACRIRVADIHEVTNCYMNSNCSVFMKDSGHGDGVFNSPQTIIEVPEYEDEMP